MYVLRFEGSYLREQEENDQYLRFTKWVPRARHFSTFRRAFRYLREHYAPGTEICYVVFGIFAVAVNPRGREFHE